MACRLGRGGAALGDALITRDTGSGLEWLDLPLTQDLSFDEIVAGECGGVPQCPVFGWPSRRWRHATGAEVCQLFTNVPLRAWPAKISFVVCQMGRDCVGADTDRV